MHLKSILIALCLCVHLIAGAENYLNQLSVENGLPDNYVKWSMRDSDGYMWFATLNGLSRWDGYSFRTYKIEHLGGYNDDVQWVAEDGSGQIWIGNPSGYFAYDRKRDVMTGDIGSLLKPLGIVSMPYTISIDGEHNLWCASGDTLYMYDFNLRKLNQYDLPEGSRLLDAKAAAGMQYILLDGGKIYKIQNEKLCLIDVRNMPAKDAPKCIFIDRNSRVWLYSIHGHGLKRIDGDKCVDVIPENLITNIIDAGDGQILVVTDDSGLLSIDDDDNCKPYINLPDNHVNNVYIDSTGILWLSTAKKGLFYCSMEASPFKIHHLGDKSDIKCIEEDKSGCLWMGSDGTGIYIDGVNYKAPQLGLPGNLIICQAADLSGRTWYGSYNSGVFYRDKGEDIFHIFDDSRFKSVRRIAVDETGAIWFATFDNGLFAMSADGKIRWYNMDNSELNNNSVMDMAYKKGRIMYLGTSSGLFTIDIYDRTIKKIENIGDHYITSLCLDSNSQLWIGSRTGVTLLDANHKVSRHIGRQEGLQNTWIRSLIEDDFGRMWIANDFGLACIYQGAATIFTSKDGVGNFGFNTHSAAKCRNGNLVFGGQGGYVVVNPSMVHPNNLDGGGKVFITSGLSDNGDIQIKYDDINVAIEVSTFDYLNLHKIQYEYRIETNGVWHRMDGNKIMFNRMSPGKYNMQVRVAGKENAPVTASVINVLPPWWRTKTAYVADIVALLMLIWIVIYYIRRRNIDKLKVQQRELEAQSRHKMDEAKLQFFTNVSHDLRTPLSLIISPLERLLSSEPEGERRHTLELMHRNAVALLDEVNQLLDFRKIGCATPRLNLSHGDFALFVRRTCEAFAEANIREDVAVMQGSIVECLDMDFDRDKMQRILLNVLSNAIKYNVPGGNVRVDLSVMNATAVLTISDTGIGIKRENRDRIFDRFYQENHEGSSGSGIGLHIVKEYVALHNGTVSVTENQPHGTVFTIKFPITTLTEVADDTSSSSTDIDAKKPTLIIAEDNNDFRGFIHSCLKGSYNVVEAVNGKDALHKLKDLDYEVDIVVSDVMMPEMDGMELCRIMKTNLQTSHIPFIMLTARTSDDHIMEGLREGADDYIMKPFNMDIFMLRVAKLIERSRRNRRVLGKTVDIEPSEVTITPLDEQFIKDAIATVERHMDDAEFEVVLMASEMGVSRSNLYKKLNALTGLGPLEFIRTVRLKRGRQMLQQGGMPVSQVAYAVGMSPKVFSKYFREQFGCRPSEFPATPQN